MFPIILLISSSFQTYRYLEALKSLDSNKNQSGFSTFLLANKLETYLRGRTQGWALPKVHSLVSKAETNHLSSSNCLFGGFWCLRLPALEGGEHGEALPAVKYGLLPGLV